METYCNKEGTITNVVEVTIQNNKNAKLMRLPYHMCGLVGHMMVDCP